MMTPPFTFPSCRPGAQSNTDLIQAKSDVCGAGILACSRLSGGHNRIPKKGQIMQYNLGLDLGKRRDHAAIALACRPTHAAL